MVKRNTITVDRDLVREALARLDALVVAHPELRTETARDRLLRWIETPERPLNG